jgi:hypothetical protein
VAAFLPAGGLAAAEPPYNLTILVGRDQH